MNVVVANAPSGAGSIASKIHLEQRLKEAINQKEITEVSVRVTLAYSYSTNIVNDMHDIDFSFIFLPLTTL
jgi:hypothetical protein